MSDCISEDISFLILKYLPVKTLLRFRCVCKWWKQLIDSPSLIQDHLSLQNPRLIIDSSPLIICSSEPELVVLDPLTLPSFHSLTVPMDGTCSPFQTDSFPPLLVGTLHGVVCLYNNDTNLLLWNPSMRKISILPLPEIKDFVWDITDDFLAYFGFWIDPSTKDFKVLILRFSDFVDTGFGAFYSSIRQDWMIIPMGKVDECRPIQAGPPVMIGGVAYWRGCVGSQDTNACILSFDFGQESFDFIELPDRKRNQWFQPTHCNWQDKLSVVYWDFEFPHRCDIYSMQEGSWVNMFGFNFVEPMNNVYWVLGEMEEGLSILGTTKGGNGLVLYDKRVGCTPVKDGGYWSYEALVTCGFVESLLFPSPCDFVKSKRPLVVSFQALSCFTLEIA